MNDQPLFASKFNKNIPQKGPPSDQMLIIDTERLESAEFKTQHLNPHSASTDKLGPRSAKQTMALQRASTGGIAPRRPTLVLKREHIQRGGSPASHSQKAFLFSKSPTAGMQNKSHCNLIGQTSQFKTQIETHKQKAVSSVAIKKQMQRKERGQKKQNFRVELRTKSGLQYIDDTSEDLNNRDEDDPLLNSQTRSENKENAEQNLKDAVNYQAQLKGAHCHSTMIRGRINSDQHSDLAFSVENKNRHNDAHAAKLVIQKEKVNFAKEQSGRRDRNFMTRDTGSLIYLAQSQAGKQGRITFSSQSFTQSPQNFRRQKSAHEGLRSRQPYHMPNSSFQKFEHPKIVKATLDLDAMSNNGASLSLQRSPAPPANGKRNCFCGGLGCDPIYGCQSSNLGNTANMGCFSSRTQNEPDIFYNSNLVQSSNFDASKSQKKKPTRARGGKNLGAKFIKNIGDQIEFNSRACRVSNELLLDNYLAKHKKQVARSTYQGKTNFNKFFYQNSQYNKNNGGQQSGTRWSLNGANSSMGSKSNGPFDRRELSCSPDDRSPFALVRQYSSGQSPTEKEFNEKSGAEKLSSKKDKPLTIKDLTTDQEKKRKTISNTIQKLFKKDDRNQQNSPIRVSQFLVDVELIRKKAGEKLSEKHETPRTESTKSGAEQVKQSHSGKQLMSLQKAVTTEKFKEIIDNLFVPTASTYKKKEKEKEFRRPTTVTRRKPAQKTIL